jgi:hypothetical protein
VIAGASELMAPHYEIDQTPALGGS